MDQKKGKERMGKRPFVQKTLHRSETNRVIGGVAGGLGEYFDIDPTIIRIIFVLLAIFGGWGILFYLILWLVIPAPSHEGAVSEQTIRDNAQEMKIRAEKFAHDIRVNRQREDSSSWIGLLIIVLGIVFLFSNFGLFGIVDIGRLWPLILVILGVAILLRR